MRFSLFWNNAEGISPRLIVDRNSHRWTLFGHLECCQQSGSQTELKHGALSGPEGLTRSLLHCSQATNEKSSLSLSVCYILETQTFYSKVSKQGMLVNRNARDINLQSGSRNIKIVQLKWFGKYVVKVPMVEGGEEGGGKEGSRASLCVCAFGVFVYMCERER